jgi:N-acetylneuraminic acid mutarotase
VSGGRLPARARSAHDGDDGWVLAPTSGARARVAVLRGTEGVVGALRRVVSGVAALGLAVSLLGVAACSADGRIELEPRSLAGAGVRAPFAIDFATASSGLVDAAGRPTGFAVVLPATRAATYFPGRVRVDSAARELVLDPPGGAGPGSTSGIGIPVSLPSARARVETVLVEPALGSGAGERAGLWFGASNDNYIELTLASSSEGPVLRAVMEEDGTAGAPITRRVQLPAGAVRLALELQPSERVVRAYAAVGGTAGEQLLATFEAVPDAWFDRDRAGLMDGDASPRGLVGLFASAGARPAELPALAHRFRGFEVTSAGVATEPPVLQGHWQRGAASTLPIALANAAAATLGGKIYVVGGSGASRAERALFIYDPDVEAWQEGPSLPASYPAVTSPAVLAHGGALVVLGGLLPGSASATPKVIAFDPGASTWTSLPSLPVGLGSVVAQSIGGDLYVAGGLDGTSSHAELWVMRAGSNVWSPGAAMSSARHGAASAVLDGRLFVFGGTREGAALALAEVYDPRSNEWTALAPLPAPVSFATATSARDRAVVLAGATGAASGSAAISLAWSYDGEADTWSALPPGPRVRAGAAAAWRGDAVYVLGGAGVDGAVDVLKLD